MDEWKFDENEDQEDQEGEDGSDGGSWVYGGRTASIFLIDAAKEMFETPSDAAEDGEEAPFKRAIRAAHATLMRKIISSDQDLSAVVLFNTRETKNPIDFTHVYILQELERPGSEKILFLENLLGMNEKKFDKEYGHSTDASLHDALRVCQSVFSKCTSRLAGQSIMLFTCRDDPHAGDDQKQRQARRKAQDLKEAGIVLEILHIGETFDVNKFYKDLIKLDESDDDDNSQESITLADPTSRFEELMERVRRLDHKQRTTGRVVFTLAPGVEMSVGVYTAVRKMTKPYKLKLWKVSNEEVRYMKKEYLEDTGELLMPSDYVKYQIYGGRQIKFTLDEARSLSKVYDPGMQLLGFKPISSIKPYFHIKPANFIYPDEKSVQGSNKMFAALLNRCLVRKMAAIVRLVPRQGASVSWAALIPQEEQRDEKNSQVTPPGFIACHLPFAVPGNERIQKKAGSLLKSFQDLVYPSSYDPVQSAKKRPAPSSSAAPKRVKPVPASVDVEAMAKAGKADKLTMDILKNWLHERGVRVSGKKKAQLVQDVLDELGQ